MKLLLGLTLLLIIACAPTRANPKFNIGDRVRLVADPRYNNGIVYRIWCGIEFCTYDVRFGLYSGKAMRDIELIRLK